MTEDEKNLRAYMEWLFKTNPEPPTMIIAGPMPDPQQTMQEFWEPLMKRLSIEWPKPPTPNAS